MGGEGMRGAGRLVEEGARGVDATQRGAKVAGFGKLEHHAASRALAAEAQIAETDQRISRALLRAPREGTVLEVHAEPGEVATAGMPIATLGDPRRPRDQ